MRVERIGVAGGAELYTYLCRLSARLDDGAEVPLVSVLRDTLGDTDAANDRLRQVWAFGYTKPGLWRRFSAAVPFLYRRARADIGRSLAPAPVLDLAYPAKGTATKVLTAAAQTAVLDPLGAPYRAATRAYRANTSEYRAMQVFRATEVLRATPAEAGYLSVDELAEVQGRLVLSNNLLGGWVSESFASAAWGKRRERWAMDRARNWELLRQRAEENGLYFRPLRIGSNDVNFAMIWMEQNQNPQIFDAKFLGISDPHRDDRIRNWRGYAETWHMDGSSRVVEGTVAGARPARMIPLALYALDHPKVPLLMVDFRSPGKMKRREIAWRVTDDLTTGVLGLTGWGNLPYMAAKKTWMFVRGRRGAALDRMARLRAYSQLRQALVLDQHLNPALREALVRSVERQGWNPIEEDCAREVAYARRQHEALLRSADSIARELDSGRVREVRDQIHSRAARMGLRVAALATFGLYRHHDELTPERLAAVDARRRQRDGERTKALLSLLPPARPAPVNSGGGQ